MWLLHSTEWRFEPFVDSQVPVYAILSHRWEAHEVSFQDLQAAIKEQTEIKYAKSNSVHSLNPGIITTTRFSKIQKTREQAACDDIHWVWIDTCCINKESSAELSESINSMFKWYRDAYRCYVHMSDVTWSAASVVFGAAISDPPDYIPTIAPLSRAEKQDVEQSYLSFKQSTWFTRGWTLQELLAPMILVFFDADWQSIGVKHQSSITKLIEERTGIGATFLLGLTSLDAASVAQRLSWVSRRQTSRVEDMAYCMLGILDVNMPLLYGEGRKAFLRLQLEIIRKSNDESIFAWKRHIRGPYMWEPQYQDPDPLQRPNLAQPLPWELEQKDDFDQAAKKAAKPKTFRLHSGLLAQEPCDFADAGNIKWNRDKKFVKRLPYSMTNQGLQFYVSAYPSQIRLLNRGDLFDVTLNCYKTHQKVDKPIVLTLRNEGSRDDQGWRRHDSLDFQGPVWGGSVPVEEKVQVAFYIRQDGL